MKQFKRQNAQEKNLNRILGAQDTLLDLEKRKELEKDKKGKITLLILFKSF